MGMELPGIPRVIRLIERRTLPSGKVAEIRRVITTEVDAVGRLVTEDLMEYPPTACGCMPRDLAELYSCCRCSATCCNVHVACCAGCGRICCSRCIKAWLEQGMTFYVCKPCFEDRTLGPIMRLLLWK
jgi:hypothetical protein